MPSVLVRTIFFSFFLLSGLCGLLYEVVWIRLAMAHFGVTTAVMERLGADWDDWIAHDDTYIVDAENVVVLARYTATNKATGKHINVRVAHHFIVRGGRIVRFEQFVDTARVREAMPH